MQGQSDLPPKRQTMAGQLAPLVNKDDVRSLFHLFVGKPDTTQKIFDRPVRVIQTSLIDLNERVVEKLRTHHIEGLVASVDISFGDSTSIHFGGWKEFESFRWTTPKATKDIRIRWQFLLEVQGYEIPQQHALTVKLTSDGKPIEMLQAILSKHPDEVDPSTFSFAPIVCRVDFISHTLGQELIAVVDDWNKALPAPTTVNSFMSKLDRFKQQIAQLIDYSTPILIAFGSAGCLRVYAQDYDNSMPIEFGQAVTLIQWLIFTLIAVYIFDKVSKLLARFCFAALDKYGRYSMFALTSGDEQEEARLSAKNNRQVHKFLFGIFVSFLLNVIAGVFVAKAWQ